jgi:CubicO group peptidase (beta-lactamase class C family)
VIEAKMAEYRTTGVAFGIFKDGSSACRAFGITDVDNPQPVTTDTVFPSTLFSAFCAAFKADACQ